MYRCEFLYMLRVDSLKCKSPARSAYLGLCICTTFLYVCIYIRTYISIQGSMLVWLSWVLMAQLSFSWSELGLISIVLRCQCFVWINLTRFRLISCFRVCVHLVLSPASLLASLQDQDRGICRSTCITHSNTHSLPRGKKINVRLDFAWHHIFFGPSQINIRKLDYQYPPSLSLYMCARARAWIGHLKVYAPKCLAFHSKNCHGKKDTRFKERDIVPTNIFKEKIINLLGLNTGPRRWNHTPLATALSSTFSVSGHKTF